MHAQRLDHDHDHDYDHDAPEPTSSLDLSRGPENDNAHTRSREGHDEAALSVEGIVPRGPSRRVRYVIAAVFASLSLSAYAFTRPPRAPRQDAPPPVTQVDIAARAMPVAEAPTSVLVVPDAPSRRAPHGDHAHHESAVASPQETSAREATAVAAEEPAAQPATTREEPPLARLVMHQEAQPTVAQPTVAQPTVAQPTEAQRGETPATAASDDGEEREEALPTDSADEVVEAAVSAHSSEIEECINNAPDEAEGRLTVSLVIARDGAVRSATPHGPEALRSVGQCIAHAMRGWRMAVPDAPGDTSISWPFEIESNR